MSKSKIIPKKEPINKENIPIVKNEEVLFKLSDIRNNVETLIKYISIIITNCRNNTLDYAKDYAHKLCPELKEHYQKTFNNFSSKKKFDKGMLGKLIEQLFFGQEPNCNSEPDLLCGVDIKCTQFKKCYEGLNAKERLTLTNVGNKSDYTTFKNIIDNSLFTKCKYFN